MRQLTRRKLFVAVGAVPLVASAASGQETAAPATSREEDFKTARDLMTSNAALLAKVEVPMATEPAFSFKA